MTFENNALGAKLEVRELTQKDLENWMAALREFRQPNESVPEYHGAIVRAAFKAGVVVHPIPNVETVDSMKPQLVRWYGNKLNTIFEGLTTVPPD